MDEKVLAWLRRTHVEIDRTEQQMAYALEDAVDVLRVVRSLLSLIPDKHQKLAIEVDKPIDKVFELLDSLRAAQEAIVSAKGELPILSPKEHVDAAA